MADPMEVDEEHYLDELCAEILENWKHPNVSDTYAQTIANQNPFSQQPPQFQTANGTNNVQKNADPQIGVEGLARVNIEEDPEKLKRRSERFKLPLPAFKKAQADKSMVSETDSLTRQAVATVDLGVSDKCPGRKREWTNN